ncbi:MAG: type II toxin-antitoxin system prevent-host-death family antitoxin [Cyanobacteria bacterium J06623_5]
MVASNIDVNCEKHELAELINRAVANQEIITLTAEGKNSAVLISMDAFEYLVGLQNYRQRETIPREEFESQFRQALAEAGYDTREKIIDFVREVKKEIYEERMGQG